MKFGFSFGLTKRIEFWFGFDLQYRFMSRRDDEGRKEMFYLMTHFIYGYMTSDIWLRTILIVRKKTCCRHIGYSFRLTARVLLYAPSHRQDNTYHSLCYTSHGALAGMRQPRNIIVHSYNSLQLHDIGLSLINNIIL